jgi:hypothetical protein
MLTTKVRATKAIVATINRIRFISSSRDSGTRMMRARAESAPPNPRHLVNSITARSKKSPAEAGQVSYRSTRLRQTPEVGGTLPRHHAPRQPHAAGGKHQQAKA